MKEKLQEYALIAEIISAIAIVLSLIFVGIQIQQNSIETAANSETIRGQVRQDMLETDILTLFYAGDNDLLINGTVAEKINQSFAVTVAIIRSRENYWLQYNNGLLDSETYVSYRNTFIRQLSQTPFTALLWLIYSTTGEVNPNFVDEINAALHEADINLILVLENNYKLFQDLQLPPYFYPIIDEFITLGSKEKL